MRKLFIALFLTAIVLASFYVKAIPFIRTGYAYAEGDGIKYSYYAAALNHPNHWHMPVEPPTAHSPVLIYTANFLINFFGEINSMYLVTLFVISLGLIGIFLFVREFTKSDILALLSSLFFVFIPLDSTAFYAMHWTYAASAYLSVLFIFLIYKSWKRDFKFWIAAGFVMSAGFLIHPIPMIMTVFPTIFMYQIVREQNKAFKKIFITIIAFLATSSFWLPILVDEWTRDIFLTRQAAIQGGTFEAVAGSTVWTVYGTSFWTILVLPVLLVVGSVKMTKKNIKLILYSKNYLLFGIFVAISIFNFLSNFLNINGYWSVRYLLIYPQFSVVVLAVLLDRVVRNWNLLYINAYLIFFVFIVIGLFFSQGLWSFLNTTPTLAINQDKENALNWIEKNTVDNAKILFYNPSNDTNSYLRADYGFDAWRYFSWRENVEVVNDEINEFLAGEDFSKQWTHIVIGDRVLLEETSNTTFNTILEKGYEIKYTSGRITILEKLLF